MKALGRRNLASFGSCRQLSITAAPSIPTKDMSFIILDYHLIIFIYDANVNAILYL